MIALVLGAMLASGGPAFAAEPKLVIDGPLAAAVPCEEPAPVAIVAALRAGIPLRWARARVLFPELGLERALVRRVVVRATHVGLCAGRIVGEDVTARLVGPRGMPIEAAVATRLRPGPVLAVTEADLQVRPPPGSVRITTRDGWTAYGSWSLGAVWPAPSSVPAAPADPPVPVVSPSQLSM